MNEKSSFSYHFKENRRWWKSDKKGWIEWTHEGGPKADRLVVSDGSSPVNKTTI